MELKEVTINNKTYYIKKLLGKGKGGYSYLGECDNKEYVIKKIHHEKCDYYTFGNKIESELRDYQRLNDIGINMPLLIDVDKTQEIIVKEYIKGDTIFEYIKNNISVTNYLPQVIEMADIAKAHNLNIDYFPTNFIVQDEKLYYVDYECNEYMDEWSFSNWGIKYWSKTKEFIEYLAKQ